MSSLTSDTLGLLEDIGKTFIPPTYLVFQHADKLHVKKTGAGIISGFNDVGSLVNSLAEEGDVFWFAKPKTPYTIAEEIVPVDEDSGANPYQSAAADATNIYITAVNTKKYQVYCAVV